MRYKYRKAHLAGAETAWATAGDALSEVVDTGSVAAGGVGRVGLMLGDEVWLPEVMRVLTLRGAEAVPAAHPNPVPAVCVCSYCVLSSAPCDMPQVLHPCDWARPADAAVAASERVSENKTHLVSVARLDNRAAVGSQATLAAPMAASDCS